MTEQEARITPQTLAAIESILSSPAAVSSKSGIRVLKRFLRDRGLETLSEQEGQRLYEVLSTRFAIRVEIIQEKLIEEATQANDTDTPYPPGKERR